MEEDAAEQLLKKMSGKKVLSDPAQSDVSGIACIVCVMGFSRKCSQVLGADLSQRGKGVQRIRSIVGKVYKAEARPD